MNANLQNRGDPLARAEALVPLVLQYADEADHNCHLSEPVARALADSGLMRLAAPTAFGGEEADPMTQVRAIELISAADGSAGWNLMIGIENFGLIAPGCGDCRHLLDDPAMIMCSSTAAVGRADGDGEGYRVSGQWQFVSGCHNASLFGATVRLYDNGEQRGGNVYALTDEFEIVENWNVSGMRGSGSHDVHLDNVWVPDNQIVAPLGQAASTSPLIRFPLGARLAYNKVAISLGLARAALDHFIELAEGKVPRFTSRSLRERPTAQIAIAESEVRLRAARALVFELLEAMWQRVVAGDDIPLKDRALFHIACSDAVRGAVEAVDRVVDAAGTTANFMSHPLERISRDVRVVRQHLTVASHNIEDGGRVLLGLDPRGAMLNS